MAAWSVPTNVQGYNSYLSVVLSWDSPSDDGTYPLSGYEVRIELASTDIWGTPVAKNAQQHSHTFTVTAGVYDMQARALM